MWKNVSQLLCGLALFLTACHKTDGPSDMPLPGEPVSVQFLKTRYKGYPLPIAQDWTLSGQVVNTDLRGNFAYTLVVEDETGGIEIKTGMRNCYRRYPLGQRVYVRCNGLVLGNRAGTFQLGVSSDDPRYECGLIPSDALSRHLISEGLPVEEIRPADILPSEFSPRYVSCAVRLSGAQFIREDADKSWGDGTSHTERALEFCAFPEDTLWVSTSPEATFASYPLPKGNGVIEGVLGRFNEKYRLVLNDPDRLLFRPEDRCDRPKPFIAE